MLIAKNAKRTLNTIQRHRSCKKLVCVAPCVARTPEFRTLTSRRSMDNDLFANGGQKRKSFTRFRKKATDVASLGVTWHRPAPYLLVNCREFASFLHSLLGFVHALLVTVPLGLPFTLQGFVLNRCWRKRQDARNKTFVTVILGQLRSCCNLQTCSPRTHHIGDTDLCRIASPATDGPAHHVRRTQHTINQATTTEDVPNSVIFTQVPGRRR